MLRVIDTYEEIKGLFRMGSFDVTAYEKYAGAISETLPAMVWDDAKEYDFETQILPVLQNLFSHQDLAETAHRSFLKAVDGLEEKCASLPCGRVDSAVVFYLGLCAGAGWAAELDGRPAVLLGLEKIVELNWVDEVSMTALLYHELGHHWHFQNRKAETPLRTPRDEALWQLYTEGVAMYFEQLLWGGRFYHQDKDGWLDWCDQNRGRIAAEYRKRAESGESVQDFFGDWCSYEGRSDVGYYLGAETVRLAAGEMDARALVNLSPDSFGEYLDRI